MNPASARSEVSCSAASMSRVANSSEGGLFISCPWRIDHGSHIVTGSQDWFTKDPSAAPAEDDDWSPGLSGTLQEAKLRQLLEMRAPTRR